MGYKCKNCGYQFRDGDGDICPECLTPIEQSADCSQYHSHDTFDNKGFSNPNYANPSYTQRDYQEATSTTVKKPRKIAGAFKAIILIIILVTVVNGIIPLLTKLMRSNSFDNLVESVVSEVVETSSPEEEHVEVEVKPVLPAENTLAVGETIEINTTVKDDDEEYTYLSITNLGRTPENMDFGENHEIYALDIQIFVPEKEYSSSDMAHIYFSPKIEANHVDYKGNIQKDKNMLYAMPSTFGLLPSQLDNSLIIPYNTVIVGTLYFDVNTKNYANKSLVVETDYYDDNGKHQKEKITLAQIDKEIKK